MKFPSPILLALLPLAALLAGCATPGPAPLPMPFSAPVPARIVGETHLSGPALLAPRPVPLQVTIDVSRVEQAAPGIRAWAEHAAALCREWYPLLCDALPSEGFVPRRELTLVFRPAYGAIAAYHRGRITFDLAHLRTDPTNYGMLIHELAHAVQDYPNGTRPVWLVEGIADYVRFYLYEVDPARGWIRPGQSKYTDSYRTTAAFLDYLVRTYDRDLVRKLNAALRRPGMTEDEAGRLLAASATARGGAPKTAAALFAEFVAQWSPPLLVGP